MMTCCHRPNRAGGVPASRLDSVQRTASRRSASSPWSSQSSGHCRGREIANRDGCMPGRIATWLIVPPPRWANRCALGRRPEMVLDDCLNCRRLLLGQRGDQQLLRPPEPPHPGHLQQPTSEYGRTVLEPAAVPAATKRRTRIASTLRSQYSAASFPALAPGVLHPPDPLPRPGTPTTGALADLNTAESGSL